MVFTRGVSLSLDEDGGPEPATAWVGLEDTVLREQARHRRTDAYESTPMGTWRGQVHRDGEAAAGCQAGGQEEFPQICHWHKDILSERYLEDSRCGKGALTSLLAGKRR